MWSRCFSYFLWVRIIYLRRRREEVEEKSHWYNSFVPTEIESLGTPTVTLRIVNLLRDFDFFC